MKVASSFLGDILCDSVEYGKDTDLAARVKSKDKMAGRKEILD